MLYSSYVGKLRERDRMIESIPWRGGEAPDFRQGNWDRFLALQRSY